MRLLRLSNACQVGVQPLAARMLMCCSVVCSGNAAVHGDDDDDVHGDDDDDDDDDEHSPFLSAKACCTVPHKESVQMYIKTGYSL